jgi:hypothetical protein
MSSHVRRVPSSHQQLFCLFVSFSVALPEVTFEPNCSGVHQDTALGLFLFDAHCILNQGWTLHANRRDVLVTLFTLATAEPMFFVARFPM